MPLTAGQLDNTKFFFELFLTAFLWVPPDLKVYVFSTCNTELSTQSYTQRCVRFLLNWWNIKWWVRNPRIVFSWFWTSHTIHWFEDHSYFTIFNPQYSISRKISELRQWEAYFFRKLLFIFTRPYCGDIASFPSQLLQHLLPYQHMDLNFKKHGNVFLFMGYGHAKLLFSSKMRKNKPGQR